MKRARTLLYGEPDLLSRDDRGMDAAEREAALKRELAQLPPAQWQRGAPVTKRSPRRAPTTIADGNPAIVRVVLPPPAPVAPRIPAAPRPARRRRRSRDGVVLAGAGVAGALLVGFGIFFGLRRSRTATTARADRVPPRAVATAAPKGSVTR